MLRNRLAVLLTTGLILGTASTSQAQVGISIGNPWTGQGISIGTGGYYGYPGTTYYNSGYSGFAPYQQGYSYSYGITPSYGYGYSPYRNYGRSPYYGNRNYYRGGYRGWRGGRRGR